MRRLLALLSAGLLTTAVSETVFWGSFERAYTFPGVLLTVLPYVVAVVAALYALERLRPPGTDGLLLAGALVGWLVEGVVVATTYEALPVSVAVTALSWHALLSVLGAWWFLPRLLRLPLPTRLAGLATAGAAWGGWSAFMEHDAGVDAPVTDVVTYFVLTAGWLAAATWAWDRRPAGPLVPTAAGRAAVGLLAAAFVLRAVALPVAAAVLPPLLAVTLVAMRTLGRRGADRLLATEPPRTRLTPGALAALAVVPVAALLVHATVGPVLAPATGPLVYVVTALVGTALWVRALHRAARPRRQPAYASSGTTSP